MVRALSKKALHIPDQRLLKSFESIDIAQELQLKYITGNRAFFLCCFRLAMQSRA